MTPYLSRLLEKYHLTLLPSQVTGKKPQCFLITKGVIDRLSRILDPVSLTSVSCNQLEHVKAGYLRHVWNKNDWLQET